jgi:hypothetical protein
MEKRSDTFNIDRHYPPDYWWNKRSCQWLAQDVQDWGLLSWLAKTIISVKAINLSASERTQVLIDSRSKRAISSQRHFSRDKSGDMNNGKMVPNSLRPNMKFF